MSEEKLTCVSPDIEGLLVNYGTTPASVTDFKAPIEFECTPKDGSSSEWTVENITWVKTVIPEILDPIFNYSSCKQPEYAQDSNCHDITNTPECNFDGGACCGDNVDKSYCIKCECKETCSLNRSESSDRIDGCFSKFFLPIVNSHTECLFLDGSGVYIKWCHGSLVSHHFISISSMQ